MWWEKKTREHLVKERLVDIFKGMLVSRDLGSLICKYRWSTQKKTIAYLPQIIDRTLREQLRKLTLTLGLPFAQPVACLSCLSVRYIIHTHPSVSKVSSSRDTFAHLSVSPIFYRFSLLLMFLHCIVSHYVNEPLCGVLIIASVLQWMISSENSGTCLVCSWFSSYAWHMGARLILWIN